MTKIRSTKNALISAVLVLCMTLTALLGTTFAWFTDSVTSSGNKIVAGTLKVDLELMDEETGEWRSLKNENAPIFTSEKWEPGYTEVKMLKVENEGNLALSWKTVLTKYSEISALADVIDVYVRDYGVLEDASAVQYPAERSLEGYTLVGTAAEFLETMEATTKGFLEAEQSAYLGIALKMRETAGNEYQGMSLGGSFDITVLATQGSFEEDSYDNSYDKKSDWPFYSVEYVASAPITDKADGILTATVSVGDTSDQISAIVPEGVKLSDGAESLTLSVTSVETPSEQVNTEAGETAKSVDVHVDGVAENNTVPMLVTLRQLFDKGLNTTSVKMYHIEDGAAVAMTYVPLAELDAHNEFYYDPATGDVIMSVASFSEYVAVTNDLNLWEGEFDISWYNTTNTEFTLTTADQLAGFGKIVDGTAEGIEADTFAGKTVKLGADIDLSGGYSLNPIGCGYVNGTGNSGGVEGRAFEGTFDGQEYAIRNLYQNGWELGLSYNNLGGGLFASVHNATIKNLTMVNAHIVMECVEQGVVAGLAQGNCTFENIEIQGCSVANYQRATGGVVGEVSWGAGDATEFTHTFKDINIDSTTVIGSLWGDFDAPVGGVIGGYWDDNSRTKVVMENVNVACRLDVYNDVTSTYRWYSYRRAGMLIGNSDRANGHTATADYLTCSDVTVRYGDWTNYHYCEFTNHNSNWPFVRVEAGENCTAYSNPRYGVPNDASGNKVVDANHAHQDGDDCMVLIKFGQLYGGGQGVYGETEHTGVTTSTYAYTIQYINDNKILAETFVESNESVYTLTSDSNYDTAVDAAKKWVTDQGYNVEFGGWVNAGSTKVTEIAAGNTETIKLYPYFNSPYTARFVDQNGNVLAWCLFHSEKTDELENTRILAESQLTFDEGFSLDYWEVHITDDEGNTTATEKYDGSEFTSYESDVTIYPVYKFNGDVQLTPVDVDGDGDTDEYHVNGYTNPDGQDLVEIPDYVNGIPITAISADAFSSYAGVHAVVIPNTVTTVGGNVLATDWVAFDSGETVTIYFEGSYDEWIAKEAEFDDGWDDGLGESSRIFFLDETGKVDTSEGYLQAKLNGYTQWDKNITWSKSTVTIAHYNEYYNTCNCDSCNGADRPDKAYWEGVVVSE